MNKPSSVSVSEPGFRHYRKARFSAIYKYNVRAYIILILRTQKHISAENSAWAKKNAFKRNSDIERQTAPF